MTTRKGWLGLSITAVFAVALVLIVKVRIEPSAEAQIAATPSAAKRLEDTKKESVAAELDRLLAFDGIRSSAKPDTQPASESAVNAVIRLSNAERTPSTPEFGSDLSATAGVSLIDKQTLLGRLSRQRSLELSETLILAVFVDSEKKIVWNDLLPDPRLVRAEHTDKNGELTGEKLYRNAVEMILSYPAERSIAEIRLYHPQWDGQSFHLQFIGSVAV